MTTVNSMTTADRPPARLKLDRGLANPIDIGSALMEVKVWSSEALGSFSLIEYVIPPHTLVAPLHRHTWEDEYSFVLEGRMGVVLGDEVIQVEEGELACKPRRLWHTVWNPEDTPCRVLEIISPGGFERLFAELASALREPTEQGPSMDGLGARYGVDSDPESVAELCAEHGLSYRFQKA